MRKRTAGGKSTTRWRLSFWRFSIGFRIITALFHRKGQISLEICPFQLNPPLRVGEILLRNMKYAFSVLNRCGDGWI